MTKQEEKEKVRCTYCGKIFQIDKDIADKRDETTAFCCKECMREALS